MSLSPAPQTSPLSPSITNASEWRSTVICQKLLCFCYYYSRCFGMVALGIKRCKENKSKNGKILLEGTSNICISSSNEIHIQTNSTPKAQLRKTTKITPQAHTLKSMLRFHIVIRFITCICYISGVIRWWLMDDSIFTVIANSQLITIIVCPPLMLIVEIWHKRKLIRAINALFRLLQSIKELHYCYGIFQWTHVTFVALKVVLIIYEIIVFVQNLLESESWFQLAVLILQTILLIQIWLNLHVATLLYVCVDAMYGSLNHYMRHTFMLRLKVIQTFGLISPSTQLNQLTMELAKFIGLFEKVHCVGVELHYLWQMPIALTLVSHYFGILSLIYYMIWQYFETGVILMRYVPHIFKLVLDIILLSLAAHKAIESSQLIGCMGLENALLVEDEEWHRQMEQFLYHIKLYDFKLNCLGLFDITNAISLTFISGILTSISIFIPFFIKTYRIQKFLEKQN